MTANPTAALTAELIWKWFEAHCTAHGSRFFPNFTITDKKPAALVYIDDRGYRFTGDNFPTAQQIHQLRPWNKPPTHNTDAAQGGEHGS